jgi:hypothetical protein
VYNTSQKYGRKKLFAINRCKLQNDIKMDFAQVEHANVTCVELLLERAQEYAFVITLMSIRATQHEVIFDRLGH